MKRPLLAILLVGAAVAVGLQNYVFFSSLADAPGPVEDELDDALDVEPGDAERGDAERGEAEQLALAAIDGAALAVWLSEQPGPGRSPFLTRAEAEALGESLSPLMPRLTGTLWSPQRRVAWLGGRPHSEGDWIGRHQITRIGRSGVVLQKGDAQFVLSLVMPEAGEPAEESEDAL